MVPFMASLCNLYKVLMLFHYLSEFESEKVMFRIRQTCMHTLIECLLSLGLWFTFFPYLNNTFSNYGHVIWHLITSLFKNYTAKHILHIYTTPSFNCMQWKSFIQPKQQVSSTWDHQLGSIRWTTAQQRLPAKLMEPCSLLWNSSLMPNR